MKRKEIQWKYEIGIDIEDIKRFNNFSKTDRFIKNNYTPKEIKYCFSKSNPASHLAGIFCAKEALIKTIKKRIAMQNIEILHEKNGAPKIAIKDKDPSSYKISISHTNTIATAIIMRTK
jgi:holo-[acyl-carrier protein] synthase